MMADDITGGMLAKKLTIYAGGFEYAVRKDSVKTDTKLTGTLRGKSKDVVIDIASISAIEVGV